MSPIIRRLLTLPLTLGLVAPAAASEFTAGSTGADGALQVTSTNVEITLPPDGILNYTSIFIGANRVVTFKRNARNTPVFMLSQGDIVLGDGAEIRVDAEDGRSNGLAGRGGPGGFDGGSHVDIAQVPGPGQGPGAPQPTTQITGCGTGCYSRGASYGTAAGGTEPGAIYGTQLLMPLVGGSGASGSGSSYGGGGGGGAILLASDTRIAMGTSSAIRARGGGSGGMGGGSGGAIRLVAPVVEGSGQLDVTGGSGGNPGGAGRARIDTLFNTQLAITRAPSNAPYTIGSMMLAFLDIEPQIDILGVGQESIPLGYDGEFLVLLPSGSGASQEVTIKLTDFTGTVPIRVTLTPEVGAKMVWDTEVDMSTGVVNGSKTVDVTVDFPLNVATYVHVWTRPSP